MKTLTLITLVLLSSVTFAAVGENKKPECKFHKQNNRESKAQVESKSQSRSTEQKSVRG